MEDADAKLHQLARSEKQCIKCEELAACRLRAVAGAGHPHASVMFVSLCPSSEDETEDLPAGSTVMRELTEFIPSLGNGSRDKAFCTTLLKCVPRSGRGLRDPRLEEQENCFGFLSKEISITTPHYIVAIGEKTTRFLLKKLFRDLPYSPTTHSNCASSTARACAWCRSPRRPSYGRATPRRARRTPSACTSSRR